MGETTTAQEVSCAYELCRRGDPILVQQGHRPRRFHDDACRQAQHRLLKARAARAKEERALAQSWGKYLPETRQLLERALRVHGEEYARQLGEAIAKERELGMAIDEERFSTREKLDLEARNAYLEITLACYRDSVDLQEHAKLAQQCMAVGQLLGYPHLAKHGIGEGEQAWEEFLDRATGEALAGTIVYGHELLRQAEDIRQYREEYSRLGRAERQIKKLSQAEEALKQRIAELERGTVAEAKRLADERTQALQDKHRRASLLIAELKKQEQEALARIGELAASLQEEQRGHQCTLQSLRDLKQQGRKPDRRRIKELEEDLRDYQRRCQFDRLTMLQLYLHEDIRHVFRLQRAASAFTVIALDNGGTALTEHGAIQLTDDEIEQCRAFVVGQWKGPSTPEQQEVLVAEVMCSAARIQAGTRLAVIQEYLRSHPAAVIPVHRGDKTYRVIAVGQMDDKVEAVTDGRGVIRLDDEEIAQARAWAEQHLGANTGQRPEEAQARITELERLLERYQACIDPESISP